MKAVRKMDHGIGYVACVDIPEPEIVRPNDVKIKVEYCGICGTDDHIVNHGLEPPRAPLPVPVTLGHEYVGTVVEVGPEVKDFKVGDRVTTGGLTGFCGRCLLCIGGFIGGCATAKSIGYECDGAMAEYIVHEDSYMFKIPDNMTSEEAALIEPSAVACHAALEIANIKPSDVVLIFGAGPIGLLVMQFAKTTGATVGIVDVSAAEGKLKLAKELGADFVFANDQMDVVTEVMKLTGGRGVNVTFDCTSNPKCIDQAILLTCFNGQVILVGTPPADGYKLERMLISFMKEQKILNAFAHNVFTWPKAIAFIASGRVKVGPLVSHKFKFEDCEEAFSFKDPTKIKILMHP